MVRMFVFPVGSGYYEKQSAVVLAETMEEAREKLLADIARQAANQPQGPGGGPDVNWFGENGFYPSWFSPKRLDEAAKAAAKDGEDADMLPWEVTGDVAYIVGVDG
jgi:hypothetical protein